MRLFRRGGGRTTDASESQSSEDPQLTALRFDPQATLDPSLGNPKYIREAIAKSNATEYEKNKKQLEQILNSTNASGITPKAARSVTNSPRLGGMPKSKVSGGKLTKILIHTSMHIVHIIIKSVFYFLQKRSYLKF